jgi:hypothetical protein
LAIFIAAARPMTRTRPSRVDHSRMCARVNNAAAMQRDRLQCRRLRRSTVARQSLLLGHRAAGGTRHLIVNRAVGRVAHLPQHAPGLLDLCLPAA